MSLRRSPSRLVLMVCSVVIAVGLVSVVGKRGESGISDVLPKSWRPAPKQGQLAQPVAVGGPILDLQDSFAKVAEQVKPAVVSITATHVETYQLAPEQFYFGDPFQDFFQEFQGTPRSQVPSRPRQFQRRQQGVGSGVVIDPRGYILTNEHVVRGADELSVAFQFPEDKKVAGKVVGADPRSDLAVIKIEPSGSLTYAALGDSAKVRVGDWAIAVGSPFGLEQTVTVGVISAVRQSLNIEGVVYSGLLQTDAAINRGNSGGPLLNIRGEVVGINTAIYAPTGVFAGIGFAIPSNRIKDIMDQLIEKGRVVRGWMGVEIVPVNDVMARQFKLPSAQGVMVNGVQPGSPAEKAGVQRGDVIVSFDGKPTSTPEALQEAVAATVPNKKVGVRLFREGREQALSMTIAETPKDPRSAAPEEKSSKEEGGEAFFDWEGARVVALTPNLRRQVEVPDSVKGVAVSGVNPGGLGEELGMEPGDVIVSVNRKPTPTVDEFRRAVKNVSSKEGLLLDVVRRGRSVYLSYSSVP